MIKSITFNAKIDMIIEFLKAPKIKIGVKTINQSKFINWYALNVININENIESSISILYNSFDFLPLSNLCVLIIFIVILLSFFQ